MIDEGCSSWTMWAMKPANVANDANASRIAGVIDRFVTGSATAGRNPKLDRRLCQALAARSCPVPRR
jgi:hypothetical protein